MKEELAAYVYSSFYFPGKTKCFFSFFPFIINRIICRINHKVTNGKKIGDQVAYFALRKLFLF